MSKQTPGAKKNFVKTRLASKITEIVSNSEEASEDKKTDKVVHGQMSIEKRRSNAGETYYESVDMYSSRKDSMLPTPGGMGVQLHLDQLTLTEHADLDHDTQQSFLMLSFGDENFVSKFVHLKS